jgi:transcriptional regulator with XRE-family HTH domain
MPYVAREAKDFELTRARWFGTAVSRRRRALQMTGNELSRRTAELGYAVSRGAIGKIESNLRSAKIDVAELLVLAAALDIPPVLLLFPDFASDGGSEALPGLLTKDDEAVRWMSGQVSLPQKYDLPSRRLEGQPNPPNDGVRLIAAMSLHEQALETRISLVHHLHKVQDDAAEVEVAQRMLEKNSEQIEATRKQIQDAREALWGMRGQFGAVDGEDSDD